MSGWGVWEHEASENVSGSGWGVWEHEASENVSGSVVSLGECGEIRGRRRVVCASMMRMSVGGEHGVRSVSGFG